MVKMRRLSNKGYSLVEMIITIGIILVVSAMAMVTISTLNSARAKNASVQFDAEITQMVTRAKGQTLKYDELQAEHRDHRCSLLNLNTNNGHLPGSHFR